ncbi:PorT family protein [Algoriphagus sp. H41]|uniref:PorT family protein n=1 Tax=Algoriphagus oliviformis TaxID=2811231 RepID=A0ABS3C3J2_9BACT|nr:porin family protein [Algoriphagus oliviformis]MBN7811677.1 PorT family protein [Algoriphagus oliviformis]
MRKILLVFFLVGFAATAQAQLGVRAGFNSANFSNANFDAKSGFHLGAYYTFGADFLSVEPGIQYSQKGYTGEEAGSGLAVKEQLGYIDVPVLVRLKLLPALNVFAGPQASVLASSKYQKGDQTSDSSEATKGYDIGGVFGAQVKLPLGFNIQASYDLGFTSLNYFNTDVKNQVFKISAGYTFGGN